MCLCIYNPKGLPIPSEVIREAARHNNDGYGRMDLKTGKIVRTVDMEEAIKIAEQGGPAVHHFRWATFGEKTKKGCHPFQIKDQHHLFHNGAIHGFRDEGRPDSHELAKILSYMPKHKWVDALKVWDSRFLIASKDEQIMVGEWVEQDGVWYSNGFHLNGSEFVAVYGTLKWNGDNHRLLGRSELYANGHTKEEHRLCLSVGGVPHMIEGTGGKEDVPHVEVEVYRVDKKTLDLIDMLEGHPKIYERRKVAILTEDEEEVSCWVYFAPEQYDTGNYLPCYGESWFDEEEQDEELICPTCNGENVGAEQGYLFCEDCLHFTSDSQIHEWRYEMANDEEQ